jgi:hypothetical protein
MSRGQKRYAKVDGEVIFVDESGTPGLSTGSIASSPYYTIGFVYCHEPAQLRTDLKRLLKREHRSDRYPAMLTELKFYLPRSDLMKKGYTSEQLNKYEGYLPTMREKAIEIICKEAVGVFAAILDKSKAHLFWTNERIGNYIFAQTLFLDIMNNISPRYPPAILYDRGRLSPMKNRKFKEYVANKDRYFETMDLKSYKGQIPTLQEQSSYAEPGIWAADLVAGSFECKYRHNEPYYADLLKTEYIATGERVYWLEK